MGMMIGNLEVEGVTLGNTVLFEKPEWISLKVLSPDGGNVWFKDNGDGTASLMGQVGITVRSDARINTELFEAPKGYSFTSIDWYASTKSTMTFFRQMYDIGDLINYGFAKITVDDKKILASVPASASLPEQYVKAILYFSRAGTYANQDLTRFSEPAIIGIKEEIS